MTKPTLLFVVNGAHFFLSHRSNLALHAKACGWQVHVATPSDEDAADIQAMGFTFHAFDMSRSGANPWVEFRTIVRLARLIRNVNPDLIHAVTIKPVLYSGILGRLLNVKGVVMAVSGLGHVYTSKGIMANLRRMAVNWMYAMAFCHANSRVIFQNPEDMQTLLPRLGNTQAALIPGAGVAPYVFYPRPSAAGVPMVLFAGRLLWSKGVGEFVEAAQRLQHAGIRARFVVAGAPDPGSTDSVAADVLDGWQRDGLIEWLGWRDDMPELFGQATIVCLPTYYGEGVPKVLIEAAMAGRAIVATDWPGCREIVEHDTNGLLVEPRCSSRLAEALNTLLQSPTRCAVLGEEGRKRALAGFTEKEVVQQTFDVYHKLLGM